MKIFLMIAFLFLLTACFGNNEEETNGAINGETDLNNETEVDENNETEEEMQINYPEIDGFELVSETEFPGQIRLLYSGEGTMAEAQEVFTKWALGDDWSAVETVGYTATFERGDYSRYLIITSLTSGELVEVTVSYPTR